MRAPVVSDHLRLPGPPLCVRCQCQCRRCARRAHREVPQMSCRDLQTKSSCMCCWLRLNKVSLVLSLGEAIFLVSCVVIYIITFTQDRRRDSPATCAAARGTTQTRCCVASCRRVSSCLSAAPDTTYAFPAATIVGSWSVTRSRCQWQTRHPRRLCRTCLLYTSDAADE